MSKFVSLLFQKSIFFRQSGSNCHFSVSICPVSLRRNRTLSHPTLFPFSLSFSLSFFVLVFVFVIVFVRSSVFVFCKSRSLFDRCSIGIRSEYDSTVHQSIPDQYPINSGTGADVRRMKGSEDSANGRWCAAKSASHANSLRR